MLLVGCSPSATALSTGGSTSAEPAEAAGAAAFFASSSASSREHPATRPMARMGENARHSFRPFQA